MSKMSDLKRALLINYERTSEAVERTDSLTSEDRQSVLASLDRTYELASKAIAAQTDESAWAANMIDAASEVTFSSWSRIRASLKPLDCDLTQQ